jgi:hypothetical protein
MIEIEGKIVSSDLFDRRFVCDLAACKGACCVAGDSGAPLTPEEAEAMPEVYAAVKEFLSPEGIDAIDKQGTVVWDSKDGESLTPLVDGKQCAYTVFEQDGTAACGIEKAWKAGKTGFRKPVSCHLYPVRIKKYPDFEALNYDEWDICDPACKLGEALKVPVYIFVKDALIRRYGAVWYEQLSIAAGLWEQYKK